MQAGHVFSPCDYVTAEVYIVIIHKHPRIFFASHVFAHAESSSPLAILNKAGLAACS